MSDETRPMSLEYLLRVRSDLAMATLEAMLGNLRTQTQTLEAVFEQMKMLDKHYQLESSTGKGPMGDIVETLRRMQPELTEGLTDEQVIAKLSTQPQGDNQ